MEITTERLSKRVLDVYADGVGLGRVFNTDAGFWQIEDAYGNTATDDTITGAARQLIAQRGLNKIPFTMRVIYGDDSDYAEDFEARTDGEAVELAAAEIAGSTVVRKVEVAIRGCRTKYAITQRDDRLAVWKIREPLVAEPMGSLPAASISARRPPMLDQAIRLAAWAHEGQTDKIGEPYILHPIRVMQAVRADGEREGIQAVAVLHDAVEDTPVAVATLDELFPKTVGVGVEALTRGEDEDYTAYLARIVDTDAEAGYCGALVRVKLADLRDNLDESRIAALPDRNEAEWLFERYRRAVEFLLPYQNDNGGGTA